MLSSALYSDENVEDEWEIEGIAARAKTQDRERDQYASWPTEGKRDTSDSLAFSGGQWAKICFARSLMKDADLRWVF